MNDVTVLITAAGCMWMPGIAKSIRENGERKVRLVGADMNKDDTILEMFDVYYQVPKANDPQYIDSLLDICAKEKVDVLIPKITDELEPLAINKDRFEKIGTKVAISSLESIRISNNKLLLFDYLKKENLPCPKYVEVNNIDDVDKAVEKIGLPIVFKTLDGSGSRGMRIIDPSKSRFDLLFNEKPNGLYIGLKEFKEILSEGQMPKMLAMEYLPGNEYTVDMLVDNGKVNYSLCRRSLNISNSIIIDGIAEDKPDITNMCNIIAEKLKLNGNIGFDIKERQDGTPVIMECNPRATAGLSVFVASGINLSYYAIKQLLNEDIPQITPEYNIITKRRYVEMYDKQ